MSVAIPVFAAPESAHWTIDVHATAEGWAWEVRQGAEVLKNDLAASGDEAVSAARVWLDEHLDQGGEAEYCSAAWSRSVIAGGALADAGLPALPGRPS